MQQQYVLPFIVGWAAFGIALASVVFIGAVWLLDGSTKSLLFMVPPVLLIFSLNIWLVRVCDSCAALVHPRYLVPANYCPKCGAPLQ